jgi:hypothetical protein
MKEEVGSRKGAKMAEIKRRRDVTPARALRRKVR